MHNYSSTVAYLDSQNADGGVSYTSGGNYLPGFSPPNGKLVHSSVIEVEFDKKNTRKSERV